MQQNTSQNYRKVFKPDLGNPKSINGARNNSFIDD